MKRITYTNNMPYTFDPSHRGAPYMVGKKWKNHGQYMESVVKFHRGYEHIECPATAYNMGSDIEEMSASVKSGKGTLASVYGPSKEAILDIYFANVASTLWIFATEIDGTVYEYHMNATEFRTFCETFGTLARESGSKLMKVRFKEASGKMLHWLDKKVG